MKNEPNRIDCYKCVHFAVSWNPKFPRACKLYGFISAALPSITVYNSTGSECIGFENKSQQTGR